MQTNAQNDTSTDLKLPTSGFGFLPHRQTDRQANTTTQNDKSTSLKLPASGVIIIIDRFYIVLFSALEQTHCARMWFVFFKYPPKWCTYSAGMAGATRNCCYLGAFCVHHTTMHHMQSHIRKVYACLAVTCHLRFLAEWPGSFTCYCGNTGVERIAKWVSTESRPWRRKFSHRSSRDSNPQSFNHESGALTTELSPPPWCDVNGCVLTSSVSSSTLHNFSDKAPQDGCFACLSMVSFPLTTLWHV